MRSLHFRSFVATPLSLVRVTRQGGNRTRSLRFAPSSLLFSDGVTTRVAHEATGGETIYRVSHAASSEAEAGLQRVAERHRAIRVEGASPHVAFDPDR